MERFFLHNNGKFPAIKRKNIVFSIVLGIFYAFVFYSFLYLSREIIRLFSVTDKYDIWVLSDKEVNFYNLFFAFLSLIFAQSICFAQWFGKPRRVFEKVTIQKSAIINDQRFLNNFFFSWFSRLATLYALFIGIAPAAGFYVFSFYPKYNFMFVLILIVLFLQTWVTILRIYKRKTLKWMLYSAVIISALAFMFSRINLVDYKSINKIVLEKNIAHKYNLELAEVRTFDYSEVYSEDIYIVKQQSDTGSPLIIFNNNELSFNEMEQFLPNYIKSENYFFDCPLYIDKSIKMSYIKRIKEIMENSGLDRVVYAVIPEDREFDKRYYTHRYFEWSLIDKKEQENTDLKEHELLTVSYENNRLQLNNVDCPAKDFYSKVKQQIEEHSNYFVIFYVTDEMAFSDYIFVLSEFKRAVETLRNDHSIKKISVEYEMI